MEKTKFAIFNLILHMTILFVIDEFINLSNLWSQAFSILLQIVLESE